MNEEEYNEELLGRGKGDFDMPPRKVKPEVHVHDFNPVVTAVSLHKYDLKRRLDGPLTGVDTLKQRRCCCGVVETYDLERTMA